MNRYSAASCLHTKEVMQVTGKSAWHARSLLNKIRQKLGKEKHQYVIVKELAEYIGLRPEEVLAALA